MELKYLEKIEELYTLLERNFIKYFKGCENTEIIKRLSKDKFQSFMRSSRPDKEFFNIIDFLDHLAFDCMKDIRLIRLSNNNEVLTQINSLYSNLQKDMEWIYELTEGEKQLQIMQLIDICEWVVNYSDPKANLSTHSIPYIKLKEAKTNKSLPTRFELLKQYCPELFKKLDKETSSSRRDFILNQILGNSITNVQKLYNNKYRKLNVSELKDLEIFLRDNKQIDF